MALTTLSLSGLESAAVLWEYVEYVGTALVFVGVLGETLAELSKIIPDEKRQKKVARVSAWVLILGLAIEIFGLVQTNNLSGQIIAKLNEDASGAQEKADFAKATALGFAQQIAAASERAASAESKTADVSKQAADALLKAAEANKRAGTLELKTAEQREKAAIAEKELVKLKEGLKPRVLNAEQLVILSGRLKSAPTKGIVGVLNIGDSEAVAFSQQLIQVLREAGWQPNLGEGSGILSISPPEGLTINVRSVKTAPSYAVSLQQAFFAAGILMPAIESPNVHEDSVLIFVGAKPKPKQK